METGVAAASAAAANNGQQDAPTGPAGGLDASAAALAPCQQDWAEVLEPGDEDVPPQRPSTGQVRHITCEVEQDTSDDAVFRVDGKDKSWFMQKGAITFERADPGHFRLEVQFLGGPTSRFGDAYAELSRAEQQATINWLLMVGVARGDYDLTGYKDCKSSGFYFLLHLNYRRTHWRVIGCPHNSELENNEGTFFTCNPQDGGQFELPASEGQMLGVEFSERELWLLDGGARVLRGHWASEGEGAEVGNFRDAAYYPAILTPNCPTVLRAVVR